MYIYVCYSVGSCTWHNSNSFPLRKYLQTDHIHPREGIKLLSNKQLRKEKVELKYAQKARVGSGVYKGGGTTSLVVQSTNDHPLTRGT